MIDKLSFLKVGPEGGSVSADEERLMQLFQNRAGLKKAYADLKDEFHLLRDKLKQQEGATIRVQEQLDSLARIARRSDDGLQRPGVLPAARPVENLPSTALRFRGRTDSHAGGPGDGAHKADCDAARRSRLVDVDHRLQLAAGKADLQRSIWRPRKTN
jgi:hypothetical protein